MKYNKLTYDACQPAFKKASENARKFGTPYGMVIITTPNNLDVPAGAFCKLMMDKAARWVFDCFDLNADELNRFVKENSSNNFIYVEYSYKQLGRDDAWLEEMIRECNGDLLKVKREILLKWPRSMESSVFNEEQLEKVAQFVKEPSSRIFVDNIFTIDLYEVPDLNMNYILSCDVAGGLNRDFSVINIIHPEDFRIVGDFRSSNIDTDTFKKLIEKLMTFYFRNALLVIERNSYGLNIIQSLMKDPKIEPRMYREQKEMQGQKTQKDGFNVQRKTQTILYGVDTNAITRKMMFDMLPEIVETEYDKFVSPNVLKDLESLEKKKNGKIEHSAHGHDDSIMAYLIFRYAVFHGKCFRDRFGIHPVPSRMNVRTASSVGDITRIEKILANSINYDAGISLSNNPMYQQLLEQDRKLKSNQKNENVDSFLKIIDFNNF